ncbi:MAG: zinc ribbon domain-containing protein [Bacillota bacterium]|nr:zinc ribbon domain-containing protein [Bacillota bacterium]
MSGQYEGLVASLSFSGEAKLSIGEAGLVADSLFEQLVIPYEAIERFALEDYQVGIFRSARRGAMEEINVSRLGNACQWFYDELRAAYNSRVLEAFLVTDAAEFETRGGYSIEEAQPQKQRASGGDKVNSAASGREGPLAELKVFPSCFCLLPPGKDGRRIPFAFINGLKEEDFALAVTLSTGEAYHFRKLGYDLAPFKKTIEDHIRALREKNAKFVAALCESLGDSLGLSESTRGGQLMPEGMAVPMERLNAQLPVLAAAVEKKIANSKMSDTYGSLKELCRREDIAVGIKELPPEKVEELKAALIEKLSAEQESQGAGGGEADTEITLTPEQEDALRWRIWAVAPSKDGRHAVAEFAFPDEDTATYIFRVAGEWQEFLPLFNRGMEATDFGREILSMPEEELAKEQHALYQMALDRTPALQNLRQQFRGRVIHRSAESWKKGVRQYLASNSSNAAGENDRSGTEKDRAAPRQAFCTQCGARLETSMKFCGQCGTQV